MVTIPAGTARLERLRLMVELAEEDAGLHARDAAAPGSMRMPFIWREVDHQAVVAERQPWKAVAAAPHRDRQPGPPEAHRGGRRPG